MHVAPIEGVPSMGSFSMPGTSLRRRSGQLLAGCLLTALVLAACAPGARLPASSRAPTGLRQPPLAASVAAGSNLHVVQTPIPYPFEENRGQVPADAAFLLRAGHLRATFGAQRVSYSLIAADPAESTDPTTAGSPRNDVDGEPVSIRTWTVEQELLGVKPAAPVGTIPAPTRVNYLQGPAEQWLTDVPTFHQLVRADAWTGIDVVYERSASGVEATYQVAPGADPSQIQLAWHGATSSLAEDGSLRLETPLGTMHETAPVAWQVRDGQHVPVPVRWTASDIGFEETAWGFSLEAYNPALPLTIDPTALYNGTYVGGSGDESGLAIAVDSSGAAYITGDTPSTQATFPNGTGFAGLGVPGFDQIYNGGSSDAFALKLTPNGQSLIYATYIGGSGNDFANSVAVDSSGAAYITGLTASTEATFPNGTGFAGVGTPGFDQIHNGSQDAFVVKLAPNGTTLVYGTYIGGSGDDVGDGIAIDSSGAAYIAGQTTSTQTTFPNGAGFAGVGVPGFDQIHNGNNDAFVVKLAPGGTSLVYGTYIGGNLADYANAIAVDSAGSAYVVGLANSNEATFPNGTGFAGLNVPGFDQSHNSNFGNDAFVVKLTPNGQSLVYATYIGGSGVLAASQALGVAVDSSGAAYVVGNTNATETTFPNGSGFAGLGVPGFDQTYNGGSQDGFAIKLAPNGQSLLEATYIGGGAADSAVGIALDGNGGVYIAGTTGSAEVTFPNGSGFGAAGVPGFDQTYDGGPSDAFVVKFGPTLTPTPTQTPTSTQTPTLTPTPAPTSSPVAAVCNPRPKVTVNAAAAGGGRLQVTVSTSTAPATPANRLTQLTVTIPGNARVDVQGGPQDLSGQQALPVGNGTQPFVFFVRRTAPGAVTVPLVITDTCGEWPSFVGGGASAF
jgi:hypothetical protein